jgi:Glycosyltransferase family 87
MWFYVDRVWAPPGEIHDSDLYPSWYATRELLLHGRDPYGPEVSREIQIWNYGRALHAGEQVNQNRFAYPLYLGFLLAPVISLPFPQVVRLFRWILPFCALISAPLWLYMLRWRCHPALLGSLTLLSFGNFPVFESMYLQQPVLLAATFLAGAGACLTAGHLGLAGVLLALATIKPQLTVLLALWLLLWAASDWRSRQGLIWGFGLTMLVLLGASQMLLPRWIPEFLAGIVAYQQYTGNVSLLRLLLGGIGSVVVTLGLIAGLAVLNWKTRHKPASAREFLAVSCAVLTVTVVVMPSLYPTYQIVLLPMIFLLLQEFKAVWGAGRAARLTFLASACLIGWPWLGALSLMIASTVVPLTVIRRLWIMPVSSLLLVPISLLTTFGISLSLAKRPKCKAVESANFVG